MIINIRVAGRACLLALFVAAGSCGDDKLNFVPPPPPCVMATPAALGFGGAAPNTPMTQETVLTTCSKNTVHIEAIRLAGASPRFTFAVRGRTLPLDLDPGDSLLVAVTYTAGVAAPGAPVNDANELAVTSSMPGAELTVPLSGYGSCLAPETFTPCGDGALVPHCGASTSCGDGTCSPRAPCTDMACDGAGYCRGTGCGTVSSHATTITLTPVGDVTAGSTGTVPVQFSVTGEGLCGLTATVGLRQDTTMFTSAFHDGAVWSVDLLTGTKSVLTSSLGQVNGLAADGNGNLFYVACNGSCSVGTLRGTPAVATPIASVPTRASRLAIGNDAALYVAAGLDVLRVDVFTGAVTTYASIPDGVGAFDQGTFITGLTFKDDGSLVVGEHWPNLYQIPTGGGTATQLAQAPGAFVAADEPWNEGMTLGPNGDLYVGVFPTKADGGFVYRVDANRTTQTVVDFARLSAAVPSATTAGIHGLTFAVSGTLYFTNQNTPTDTRDPVGQILSITPAGALSLVAGGFNFDWMNGFDGDLVVGHALTQVQTVTLSETGTAGLTLDAPSVPGPYEVVVYVTDPTTGTVLTASSAAVAH
ncbi:MAG: hypothetical protein HY903_14505 [Deltaproteobacteria bacterium]|nr:hypothetical protein [Deltaproteobacteria bacterium]